MSEEIKDGGPAFPLLIAKGDGVLNVQDGLTKREWFAGMASDETVSLAAQEYMHKNNVKTCSQAEARFFYADQMIQASKGESK